MNNIDVMGLIRLAVGVLLLILAVIWFTPILVKWGLYPENTAVQAGAFTQRQPTAIPQQSHPAQTGGSGQKIEAVHHKGKCAPGKTWVYKGGGCERLADGHTRCYHACR